MFASIEDVHASLYLTGYITDEVTVILVRSFAGVGEVAATLVGRGSLNQPLSEADLLRAQVDQQHRTGF